VTEILDPTTRELVSSARLAFGLLDRGQVDSALEAFELLEAPVFASFQNAISQPMSLPRHAHLWLQLSRSSILNDVSRFSEAADLMENICVAAEQLENNCYGEGLDCFAPELLAASACLARVFASQGRFDDALVTLTNVHHKISSFRHRSLSAFNRSNAKLIDEFGEALGYSNLSSKVDFQLKSDRSTGRDGHDGEDWEFPLPLTGPTNAQFYMRLRTEVEPVSSQGRVNLEDRLSNENRKLTVLNEWSEASPYSNDASFRRVGSLFEMATLEVLLDLVEQFFDTWPMLYEEALKFKVKAPEYVDAHRSFGSGFYRLGIAIIDHNFDDEATRQRMSKLVTACASEGLDLFRQAQKTAPTTQANALIGCVLMNLMAANMDGMGNKKLAKHIRNQRNAVLKEILVRDPNNGRAKELLKQYGPAKRWVNPKIADEIGAWNWSIVPTV
jgi:hypothetical protein